MADEQAQHEEGDIVSRETLKKFNKSELATYGRASYGLDISPTTQTAEEMIDRIISAARKFKGNADMKVVRMNEEVEVPPGYVKIRVSPGRHNPAERPIPVGLNFRMATIPVNKDVVMHGKWLTCLEDAVERHYFKTRGQDGDETLGYSDQHKYPFSILVDNRKKAQG